MGPTFEDFCKLKSKRANEAPVLEKQPPPLPLSKLPALECNRNMHRTFDGDIRCGCSARGLEVYLYKWGGQQEKIAGNRTGRL